MAGGINVAACLEAAGLDRSTETVDLVAIVTAVLSFSKLSV